MPWPPVRLSRNADQVVAPQETYRTRSKSPSARETRRSILSPALSGALRVERTPHSARSLCLVQNVGKMYGLVGGAEWIRTAGSDCSSESGRFPSVPVSPLAQVSRRRQRNGQRTRDFYKKPAGLAVRIHSAPPTSHCEPIPGIGPSLLASKISSSTAPTCLTPYLT